MTEKTYLELRLFDVGIGSVQVNRGTNRLINMRYAGK